MIYLAHSISETQRVEYNLVGIVQSNGAGNVRNVYHGGSIDAEFIRGTVLGCFLEKRKKDLGQPRVRIMWEAVPG